MRRGLLIAAISASLVVAVALLALWQSSRPSPGVVLVRLAPGESTEASGWKFTVVSVQEGRYLKYIVGYYRVQDGYKAVVVRFKIENVDTVPRSLDVRGPVLGTRSGRTYDPVDPPHGMERIHTAPAGAVEYNPLRNLRAALEGDRLNPRDYVEVEMLFVVPEDEEPVALGFLV